MGSKAGQVVSKTRCPSGIPRLVTRTIVYYSLVQRVKRLSYGGYRRLQSQKALLLGIPPVVRLRLLVNVEVRIPWISAVFRHSEGYGEPCGLQVSVADVAALDLSVDGLSDAPHWIGGVDGVADVFPVSAWCGYEQAGIAFTNWIFLSKSLNPTSLFAAQKYLGSVPRFFW